MQGALRKRLARPTPLSASLGMPGLAYFLRQTVYLAVTNKPRGLALPASRGPAFRMPADAGFRPLRSLPSVDEVTGAALAALESGEATDVCFAGLGDPLVRWETVAEAAKRIHQACPEAGLRLNTNGLVVPEIMSREVARALADAGIKRTSVALNAADAHQYNKLMLQTPSYVPAYFETAEAALGGDASACHFDHVCAFITDLVQSGVRVTATCVDRPGADVDAVRALASTLGASDFTVRSWHPAPELPGASKL